MFTGRRFSAHEALEMGLVNQVVLGPELEGVVRDLATTIAANAPLTIQSAKTIVEEAAKDPSDRDLVLCDELVENCMNSSDYKEGRTAFMEKRIPEFQGK